MLDEVVVVLSLHREKMEAMSERESEPVAMIPISQEETEKVEKELVRAILGGEA